jgi:predicted nucleic acid-binding protein
LKKLKIYLDTSVINFYFAEDSPEKMAITREFFGQILTSSKYEAYISLLVLEELGKTEDSEHRTRLIEFTNELKAEVLLADIEVNRIAKQFTDDGYIPEKYKEDALHLAFALFYNIDYIVSWNFKHIVRPRTKDAVRIVALKEGIKEIKILTPEEVVADESEI